jgi:group II intron reverse transcriptase/maturase
MQKVKVRVMRKADTILDIHQVRGSKGLPLECVYKHLLNPEFYLRAYGKIYRNQGAMTKGTTEETVDGMALQRIHNIIGSLRTESRPWTPVRRAEIPKANGKTRPLGIPTWGDKLVQEVLRALLEPYYEQKFSTHSHGFRPNRGCHTALQEIRKNWKGTVWFIEGDIKGCFDNIDHAVLLEIIRRDIHDGRVVRLIEGLLRAGYMEDWRYQDSLNGTPQGGIISPLLANIYLNELDRFIEDTLGPAYTKGDRRRGNPEYGRITSQLTAARKRDDPEEIRRLKRERRRVMAVDPYDPGYRRLRFVRYAADFLLGFVGPKREAEEIRQRLAEFLEQRLKLALSKEKALITHAVDGKANFLGHEITVTRHGNLLNEKGKRQTNGNIALMMPRKVISKYLGRFSRKGKIIHRTELLVESDYTIIQRYQAVLRGLYNYYCMAVNVGNKTRMGTVRWILETSLTKTLAAKFRCNVSEIYRRYQTTIADHKALRAIVQRPGKEPLVADFGGIPLVRIPDGMGAADFHFMRAWKSPVSTRSEAVQRMLAGRCELCGAEGIPIQMHHIRKLADIDRPGRRPKAEWEKRTSAMKRKTLAVCDGCHKDIHAGRYDGPRI